jgi:hypothetical protein
VKIEPGKSYSAAVTVEICANREQVAAIEKEVNGLAGATRPVIHAKPQPRYSPA